MLSVILNWYLISIIYIIFRWKREMNDMIERFKHKFDQLKKHCSIMNKENIKLKRIINNSKSNYSKRNKIPGLQKNNRYLLNYNIKDILY